ncbi:MAG TPA: hypothetical protein VMV94_14040 [Phycisphaerae bacterium]|nr:hypothetical protein [Phycisphaerae bacterium]
MLINRRAARFFISVGLLLATFVVGTLWHELVGHGLVGTLAGGRITHVRILGLDLWPEVRWCGLEMAYGRCQVDDIPTSTGEKICSLGGSLSTWCVAVAATILLWVRRWRRPWRTMLIYLSIWWIDLLTYILPTWGLRRSILWGGTYSEPYEAAVSLGIPGAAVQVFVFGSSFLLAAALIVCLARDRRGGLIPSPPDFSKPGTSVS